MIEDLENDADIYRGFSDPAIPQSIRIPHSLMAKLREEATKRGRSSSKQLIAILARRYAE